MRPFFFLFLGVGCAFAAAVVAERTDFGTKFTLDFQGERARGSAKALEDGVYRLTYRHPSGTLYSQTRHDARLNLDVPPGESAPLEMSYMPDEPDRFQPAGQAYRPGILIAALMFVGLCCVVYANRRIRHRPRPR